MYRVEYKSSHVLSFASLLYMLGPLKRKQNFPKYYGTLPSRVISNIFHPGTFCILLQKLYELIILRFIANPWRFVMSLDFPSLFSG